MLSRFLLGVIGLLLATLFVRRIANEVRRAGAGLAKDETKPAPRAVTRLKEDPRTGIYYPAD